jgi:fused signal recognition particle receptor
MLAAGDTFRAAAVEQLRDWGKINNASVISQGTGADSASVIYDAIESARSNDIDILIADTAGRLHTKDHLMEELKKIKRVITKIDSSAPHEVLLVIDAGTGQNAINQMKEFNNAVTVTGLVITKFDGTAKGGIIFSLVKKFGVPVRFVGLGENLDDLQPFDIDFYVQALLDGSNRNS